MANYVYQQIICSKDFLEKYLIDYFPICKNEKMYPPYISFNKLVGVSNLNDYREKYGEYIYYGDSFSYKQQENGKYFRHQKRPIEIGHHINSEISLS
ncbi:hypothetical protein [Streptococcus zalophi]|uniref:Uncharacterized protein n=1 Tax=Streptococcus zalophi TaxID=640031 RepID=A0A934P8V9_9STRE|nr:hypothetical protein [Streptococcus zalophi]MBJ8349120.1 hypothetical protein [Streptococcus zalophi]MCR8967728.1 hypothetical protein [Streptococcus zalophi]